MPNLQNAKKALKQSVKKEALNRQYKNRIKSVNRSLNDAIEKNNQEEVTSNLSLLFKAIDKAAKKNIIHRNTANRKKAKAYKDSIAKNTSSQDK